MNTNEEIESIKRTIADCNERLKTLESRTLDAEPPTPAVLAYLINEAVKSMEAHEGLRCGMYIRAAHDWIHGISNAKLDVCLEGFNSPTE